MLEPMRSRHIHHCVWAALFSPTLAGLLWAADSNPPLLDQAKKAFQSGKREEAVRIATKMIEADPKEPNNYFLRARFQELMGRREAALADYNEFSPGPR
jgi:Flp pilus assembly protein TadD